MESSCLVWAICQVTSVTAGKVFSGTEFSTGDSVSQLMHFVLLHTGEDRNFQTQCCWFSEKAVWSPLISVEGGHLDVQGFSEF